jgi:hypothetical protein
VGKPEGKMPLGRLDLSEKPMLKRILKKYIAGGMN